MSKVFYYKDKAYELNYDFGNSGVKTLIPSEIFYEKRLSVGARFLLMQIFNLPKGWHLRLENLAENLGISRQSIAKYLKEIYALDLGAFKEIKSQEMIVNMRDLEQGAYEISECESEADIESWSAENAPNPATNNPAKVRVFQTEQQKILLYFIFNAWKDSFLGNHSADSAKIGRLIDDKSYSPPNFAESHESTTANTKILNKMAGCAESKNVKNFNTNITRDKSLVKIQEHTRENLFSEIPQEKILVVDDPIDLKKYAQMPEMRECDRPRPRARNIVPLEDLSEFGDKESIVRDWLEYKQEYHNKYLTQKQINYQLNKIRKFIAQGADIEAIISQSIDRGYQGLFSVKEPSFNPRGFSQIRANYKAKKGVANNDRAIKEALNEQIENFYVKLYSRELDLNNITLNGRKVVFDESLRASYAL